MYGAISSSVRSWSEKQARKRSISKTAKIRAAKKKNQGIAKVHGGDGEQLPNGKNAWGRKGAERKRAEERRKWNKNKVADAGGGGNLVKYPDGKYRQTGVVNIVLYVGVGLCTLGLILTFVGIGDHGFKSPELRLIGPSLIGCGVLFALLRLFFCTTPACCTSCCRKSKPLDEKSLLSPSRETLAEGGEPPTGAKNKRGQDNPALAANDDEDDDNEDEERPTTRRLTSNRSTRTVQSIPNYIDDECEDDEALGLNVEYMDETSSRQRSAGSFKTTRPASAASLLSTAPAVPRLPEIHGAGRGSEIVLNPATLDQPPPPLP